MGAKGDQLRHRRGSRGRRDSGWIDGWVNRARRTSMMRAMGKPSYRMRSLPLPLACDEKEKAEKEEKEKEEEKEEKDGSGG